MNNKHWHEINSAIGYPLADTATEIADNGDRLPPNILVDLNLRYPSALGGYPFVGAVTVTGKLVTVVIEVANSLLPDYGLQPLAVFNGLLSDVEPGRQYALTPSQLGVAGWLAFGEGINEFGQNDVPLLSLRFGTPQQSLLCLKAARQYREMPVKGLGSYTAAKTMTGIVDVVAESPLEAVRESRTIAGVTRDVIVLRLIRQEEGTGFDTSAQEQALAQLVSRSDILQQFAGPCGKRPESRTCGNPEPIEFINSVAPDCDGVLTLDFRGCAYVEHIEDPCTILVQCNYGISQVCPRPHIPDSEGRLPNEYDPADINSVSEPTDSVSEEDESRLPGVDLPFVECFDAAEVQLTTISGSWQIATDDSPGEMSYCPDTYSVSDSIVDVSETDGAYESVDAANKHIAIWEGEDALNVGRVTTVDFKMIAPPAGGRRSGGIVLNYREHSSIPGRYVYHAVEADYDTQTLKIRKFDGVSYANLLSVPLVGLYIDRWLRLIVTVVEGPSAGQTRLLARLIDLEGTLDYTTPYVDTYNYTPSTGFNGVIADRSITRFAFFHYAEAP